MKNFLSINVILTYDKPDINGESQDYFDILLPLRKRDKDVKKYLDEELFLHLPKILNNIGRVPSSLLKVSTAANWKLYESYTGASSDLLDEGNGKWSFGTWRGTNVKWSDELAAKHGFGQ